MRQVGSVAQPARTHRDGTSVEQRRQHIERLRASEATAALVCPDCQGLSAHCRTCEGYGMVCPTCRGLRFVRVQRGDEVPEYVPRPPHTCPSCCGSDGQFNARLAAEAIRGVLIRAGVTR